ncbi:MAG: coenzyme F420-0:L-glutamate ligase, partial [Oscillospiraceae bacterium]|nr:coenzyme F420-0:L-glutamate ligase [Oscillospiraceae bacterium]
MPDNERRIGTVARGVRCPIIRKGDDIAAIAAQSVLEAAQSEGFSLRDRDVIAITESVVARAQGNYACVEDIAADIRLRFGSGNEKCPCLGLVFPILSRNRFSILLRGIAMGCEKVIIQLSYPSDEVGNALVTLDQVDEVGVDPYKDVLSAERFRELFGDTKHEFTGVDYVAYYNDIVTEAGAEAEIIFANHATDILKYTDRVLACDIQTRERTKRLLKNGGASVLYGLDDVLSFSVNGSGYNKKYGLLGSNKAAENTVKLFPRDCQRIVEDVQKRILDATGKHVEVMVYGDGAFKDPQGKIWELADPVTSPAYTDGLVGTPNELKLKYLADDKYKDLSGEALKDAISADIKAKKGTLVGKMASEGTTPRQLTDLLAS